MSIRYYQNGTISLEASPGYDLVHLSQNGNEVKRMKSVIVFGQSGLFYWVEMCEK